MRHTQPVTDSSTKMREAAGIETKAETKIKHDVSSLSANSVTGHRPTFKNIHHVEKGQRQGGLPAARATTDSHLAGRGEAVSTLRYDTAARHQTPV